MRILGAKAAWAAVLGGLMAFAGPAGLSLAGPPGETVFPTRQQSLASASPEVRVPLEEMAPEVRELLRQVLDRPTLTVRGVPESFSCVPATYHWLLEHPDQAVRMWRKLGAQCVEIADRGNGVFGWSDKLGSDLTWSTVHLTPRMRVIYASGQVKAGMLMPKVAVQAVVVIHYDEDSQVARRETMTHQTEMAIRTDSKAVSAAARLMGASAQRVGEQYMGQLQMFYSALAWYLDQHPDEAAGLLRGANGN